MKFLMLVNYATHKARTNTKPNCHTTKAPPTKAICHETPCFARKFSDQVTSLVFNSSMSAFALRSKALTYNAAISSVNNDSPAVFKSVIADSIFCRSVCIGLKLCLIFFRSHNFQNKLRQSQHANSPRWLHHQTKQPLQICLLHPKRRPFHNTRHDIKCPANTNGYFG